MSAAPLPTRTAAPAAGADWRCFGWSARAWARPWRDFVAAHPGLRLADGLEIGAGPQSSLAPLMLQLAERVECSAYDAATLPAIQALNARRLDAAQQARLRYAQRDVRALDGRWDLIVLKSVLGGLHRVQQSSLHELHATLERLMQQHLTPGGLLITLDNGRTVLEPLLRPLGARRNGWRTLRRADLPPPHEYHGFGVLSVASAATRLGRLGQRIDDGLYAIDRLLSPLVQEHAVHLSVYRRPA